LNRELLLADRKEVREPVLGRNVFKRQAARVQLFVAHIAEPVTELHVLVEKFRKQRRTPREDHSHAGRLGLKLCARPAECEKDVLPGG